VISRWAALVLLLGAVLAGGGTGCSTGRDTAATARAVRDGSGTLHVSGQGWSTCGSPVYVDTPSPWVGHSAGVEADGTFELRLEPTHKVRMRNGAVTVTQSACGQGSLEADAEILAR